MSFRWRSSRRDARRVMEQIGDAVAVLQGAPEMSAEVAFRQNNQFFYLTGVEVPRAILLIDGKAEALDALPRRRRGASDTTGLSSALAMTPPASPASKRSSRARRSRRPSRSSGRKAACVFTPLRAEVRGGGSGGEATGHARATSADPWDGRPSRETAFTQKLQAAAPEGCRSRISIRSSTPCASSRARARLR